MRQGQRRQAQRARRAPRTGVAASRGPASTVTNDRVTPPRVTVTMPPPDAARPGRAAEHPTCRTSWILSFPVAHHIRSAGGVAYARVAVTATDHDPAVPPASRTIRTFHPRRGRMSDRQTDALEPALAHVRPGCAGRPVVPVDLADLFGRRAPVVLEIGSGMGDATAAMAAADPDRDYLAVEVHTPGSPTCCDLVERGGLAQRAGGRAATRWTWSGPAGAAAVWTRCTCSSPTRGRRPGTTSGG